MPSHKKDKKYDAILHKSLLDPSKRDKTISFGAKGMSDYTIHKDD